MKNHLTTLNLKKLYILADLQKELKYKELCSFLNLKYYKNGGNAKRNQLEQLAAICDLKMYFKPTRYCVKKVYENVNIEALLEESEKWWPCFAAIILQMLKEHSTLYLTNTELLRRCSMINKNFIEAMNEENRKFISSELKYNLSQFSTFVEKTYNNILRPILRDTLKRLEREYMIAIIPAYAFRFENEPRDVFHNTTTKDLLGKDFLNIEEEIAKEKSINTNSYLPPFMWDYFYTLCSQRAKEKFGVDKFFRCHCIVTHPEIVERRLPDFYAAIMRLNTQVTENIRNSKSLVSIYSKDKEIFIKDTITPDPDVDYKEVVKEGRRKRDDMKKRLQGK